jgi:carbamoyl-phosphate synthase large subunit
MRESINILFTSSGRRVSLIKEFRRVFEEQGIGGRIITADVKDNAPTKFISDKHYIVPKISQEGYLNSLLEICDVEKINILIPLIDSELNLLAANKSLFETVGVNVIISSIELNLIASNKQTTYDFFISNDISTPKVYSIYELEQGQFEFPLIVKPFDGSSSKGVTKVNNIRELSFFRKYISNPIIQEFIEGEEFTIDVMVDFDNNIKTIVPRLRIETRSGEVSKGMTIKDFSIINEVKRVIDLLPGPVGCITLQCFKQNDGTVKFIEINPRFGGGIPLSIEAGANFPLWIIKMCTGQALGDEEYNWKSGLTMLRYDEALFIEDAYVH